MSLRDRYLNSKPEQQEPRSKLETQYRDGKLPVFMTVEELATLLRVNRNTIYELFQRGEIPGGKRVGRCIRFLSEAVLSWISRGNSCVSPHDRS